MSMNQWVLNLCSSKLKLQLNTLCWGCLNNKNKNTMRMV